MFDTIFLRLLLFMLVPFFIHAEEKMVHYTTNNNPILTGASPTFNTEINPHFVTNTTSTIHAIGIKCGDISVLIMQKIRDIATKDNYDCLKTMIKHFLWQNRYTIIAGTLLGSYTTTSLLLIADYYTVTTRLFWGHWKEQCTFEDLCLISQKELAKELMLAIGQHHYNKDNPTDLAYPLIAFIKDIDKEIDILKRYIMSTKIIKQLKIMPIFPTNDNKINRAIRLLERTLFIKHIFLSWLADYNLTSTENLNSGLH